ncbi:MAG: hypothetical protein V4682_01565 [Patescibacteria group bacterium]
MARGPQQHNRRNEWLHFFAGSPQRLAWTAVGLFVVFAMFFPISASIVLNNVLTAFVNSFGPSAGPLLAIAISVWAIWYVMIRPFRAKKKKKSDH